MSAFHAALAGTVTTIGVGMVAVARTWPAPAAQPSVRAVLDEVSLDELLDGGPEPVHGTPVVWAFRYCPRSGRDQPQALHADGSSTCSCCFTTTATGDRL